MTYLRATSLDDALAELARQPRRVICGGTDAYADPAERAPAAGWLDVAGLDALRGIATQDGAVRLGAAVTWDEIDRSPLMPTSLREAARQIGARPIRIAGSIGGNLCHAASAADGVPPLLTLEAHVELASVRGLRRRPLDQFLLGRRRTARQPDELMTAITWMNPGATERTAFIKCANRDGTALAVVSAAVRLRWSEAGMLALARIAIGAASEVPVRARELEAHLEGARPQDLTARIRDAGLPELSPIDDVRGSAALRRHLARIAVERACARCNGDGERA